MDWREFTAHEHRYRMVAIRGHTWRICMSWRTKRGQRSAVHGAKCINDGVRSLCHCRVESVVKGGRVADRCEVRHQENARTE